MYTLYTMSLLIFCIADYRIKHSAFFDCILKPIANRIDKKCISLALLQRTICLVARN